MMLCCPCMLGRGQKLGGREALPDFSGVHWRTKQILLFKNIASHCLSWMHCISFIVHTATRTSWWKTRGQHISCRHTVLFTVNQFPFIDLRYNNCYQEHSLNLKSRIWLNKNVEEWSERSRLLLRGFGCVSGKEKRLQRHCKLEVGDDFSGNHFSIISCSHSEREQPYLQS